jgi:hypothetical protein
MSKDKKQKEYQTLLSVIAYGSTDDARKLLKKHSGQDAKNPQDLEVKLARVYALSTSKIDLEKEFAEIHPHKDFILKYKTPKQVKITTDAKPLEKPISIDKAVKDSDVKKSVSEGEEFYNANAQEKCNCGAGKGHPPCGNPNCEKCSKYFSADGQEGTQSTQVLNQRLFVLGLVSVVAIFGMVLYTTQKHK